MSESSQSVLFSHYGYYRVLNLARQLALINPASWPFTINFPPSGIEVPDERLV
jgi:hypothetical protein